MLTLFEYLLLAIFVAVLLFVSRWVGLQAYSWMPAQATAEAQQVDNLFSFLVSVGAFVFLGVIGVIVFSILFYRAPAGDYSEGHPMRGSWKIEVLWTIVPILLVLWIAAQSYRIYERLSILGLAAPVVHLHGPVEAADAETVNHNNGQPAAEEIEVISKQWAWSFRYPNNVTSNELHLPVNQSVRLALKSEDVLHGFYVPEFRVKQDIIPKRTITFVFTPIRIGKYTLQDSQFSGTYFALMDANVYVESPVAYHQWLERVATRESTLATSRAVSEHSQPVKKILNSGWSTLPPA